MGDTPNHPCHDHEKCIETHGGFGDPPFREAPKYSWVDNGRYSGLVDVPLFLVDVNGRIS